MSGATLAPPRDADEAADSDQRLVAAVRRGDDRAFEVLYQRYQRRIHAYVLGMVKDHGRAEDVTQEVFVSALRRMRETEQPLAFKPWLYQIAKNSCIDAFRRSKRAEEVSYDADDALAPADHSKLVGSGPSPDAAVAAKQDLDNLCGAFGGLSETHHEILVLRELEGLSYQEIGKRMGMSRPAVESTLFRARRRLTEEYDDIVSGARCLRIHGDHRHRGRVAARARATRAASPATSRTASPAAARRSPPGWTAASSRARACASASPRGSPASCRSRRSSSSARGARRGRGLARRSRAAGASHLPMLSDQLSSGWGKAAAGAAVLVAGVGAGGRRPPGHDAPRRPPRTAPAHVQPAKASAAAKPSPTDAPKAPRVTPRRRRRDRRVEAVDAQARPSRAHVAAEAASHAGGRAHRPPPTVPRRPAAARCRPRPVRTRRSPPPRRRSGRAAAAARRPKPPTPAARRRRPRRRRRRPTSSP